MKSKIKKILLAAVMMGMIVPLSSSEKVIYGEDNRVDYYAMPDRIKDLADSVVSLWKKDSVEYNYTTKTYDLKTTKFKDRLNLCEKEPFREQPIGAFCSGSLISEDTVITAGHCIKNEDDCANTYFVFGYAVKDSRNPNKATTKIPVNDIYQCKKIVRTHVGPEPTPDNPQGVGLGPDYAIIKLDRKVVGRKPLKINTNQKLRKGQRMFVIGHPVGLPVKLADDAYVRDATPGGYFVANLDTYGGNSGSPVFNMNTFEIEGILVRGDTDFTSDPNTGCVMSNVNPNDGGRGEDVTKISALYKYLDGIIPVKNTEITKEVTFSSQDLSIKRNVRFDF